MSRTFGRNIVACACASAMALVVPHAVGAQDGPSMDELRSSYESAVNAGNAADVARWYAEDAVVLPPNVDRLEGRAGVERYFTEFMDQRRPSGLEITSEEDRQVGEAYLDTGTYSMTVSGPDGQPMEVGGDYVSLVEQVGGEWLITRHIWNQDMPQ